MVFFQTLYAFSYKRTDFSKMFILILNFYLSWSWLYLTICINIFLPRFFSILVSLWVLSFSLLIFIFLFLSSTKDIFKLLSERRWGGWGREREIDLLFHLFKHSSCALTRDWTHDHGVSGWRSNQLSHPTRDTTHFWNSKTFTFRWNLLYIVNHNWVHLYCCTVSPPSSFRMFSSP